MKQDICCRSWLKKEGRELLQAENWPACHNTVTNPELSGGRVPLQDEYCHKTESENKWWAGFSLQRYNPQYMSTCKRSGCVSVNCWGWISHEGAGILHRIEGQLEGLQYQQILQNVMVPSVRTLYPDGVIRPLLHSWFSGFKNGYCGRPTSNSLTGHCNRLIWTPSRKCGVRWKGQCRKPGVGTLLWFRGTYKHE